MGTAQRITIAGYRTLVACASIIAIVTQLHRHVIASSPVSNFFSYFTIESNLLGIGVFLVGAWLIATRKQWRLFDTWRGAATVYLVITGIVYALLLSNLPGGPGDLLPWVNSILHQVFPLAIALDWIIVPTTHRIAYKTTGIWLIYPLVYVVYSLIRGRIVHWYPYPFLDPSHGYARVGIACVGILVGGLVVIALIIGRTYIGNKQGSTRMRTKK